MINMALYRRGIRESAKLLAIFCAVLTMYFIIIIPMFDPRIGSAIAMFSVAMPELMSAFGMNPSSGSMLGFLAAYLYGFLMLIFPMIYSIIMSNKLMAKHVDSGSMSYLLAAPVSRVGIAFTQMKVIASGLIVLIAFPTLVGIAMCAISFPGALDIGRFLLLNLGALCAHLFIGGICFLCSCAFGDGKLSVGFGAGIPTLAFIFKMFANMGGALSGAKYLTFFTLYDTNAIIAGESAGFTGMLILFAGSAALFLAAITVFHKKDLHI